MCPLLKGSLSAVEVFAETRFEVSAERSPLTYQWEGHGLRLQLPEETTASFSIRAVCSSRFELPEGTELVSPVYWVTCEGEVGGWVRVEVQHCARVRQEGQWSGLSFAVCKVEKAEPPYWFELHDGQFSSRSSYGRVEVKFSRSLVAIIRCIQRWGPQQPTADSMFLTKIYYHQQQLTTTAHFVMMPQVDLSKVGVVSV